MRGTQAWKSQNLARAAEGWAPLASLRTGTLRAGTAPNKATHPSQKKMREAMGYPQIQSPARTRTKSAPPAVGLGERRGEGDRGDAAEGVPSTSLEVNSGEIGLAAEGIGDGCQVASVSQVQPVSWLAGAGRASPAAKSMRRQWKSRETDSDSETSAQMV